MPLNPPAWSEVLSCAVCVRPFNAEDHLPISLICGHTMCRQCLLKLQSNQCPFDHSYLNLPLQDFPPNLALLQVVLGDSNGSGTLEGPAASAMQAVRHQWHPRLEELLGAATFSLYRLLEEVLQDLALYLRRAPSEKGGSVWSPTLSRSLQRKLVTIVTQGLLGSEEGRGRLCRSARALGERCLGEILLVQQNPSHLTANLWAAVRARGCQFLGPAMQEEVLKLILLTLSEGALISRKVLVMYVVQSLEREYPQASKTSVGHVVQLLYRASCFNVFKREGESSLMQLKEEFRNYEALRREHDAQLVQIAQEAGLRISPDQWSALLYGDQSHRSHMQSIVDKLQNPASFSQSIQELLIGLQRHGDPENLCALRPQFEILAGINPLQDSAGDCPSWEDTEKIIRSLSAVLEAQIRYCSRRWTRSHHSGYLDVYTSGRYKTTMCRDILDTGVCPRGEACTFAHSAKELASYRYHARSLHHKGGPGGPGGSSTGGYSPTPDPALMESMGSAAMEGMPALRAQSNPSLSPLPPVSPVDFSCQSSLPVMDAAAPLTAVPMGRRVMPQSAVLDQVQPQPPGMMMPPVMFNGAHQSGTAELQPQQQQQLAQLQTYSQPTPEMQPVHIVENNMEVPLATHVMMAPGHPSAAPVTPVTIGYAYLQHAPQMAAAPVRPPDYGYCWYPQYVGAPNALMPTDVLHVQVPLARSIPAHQAGGVFAPAPIPVPITLTHAQNPPNAGMLKQNIPIDPQTAQLPSSSVWAADKQAQIFHLQRKKDDILKRLGKIHEEQDNASVNLGSGWHYARQRSSSCSDAGDAGSVFSHRRESKDDYGDDCIGVHVASSILNDEEPPRSQYLYNSLGGQRGFVAADSSCSTITTLTNAWSIAEAPDSWYRMPNREQLPIDQVVAKAAIDAKSNRDPMCWWSSEVNADEQKVWTEAREEDSWPSSSESGSSSAARLDQATDGSDVRYLSENVLKQEMMELPPANARRKHVRDELERRDQERETDLWWPRGDDQIVPFSQQGELLTSKYGPIAPKTTVLSPSQAQLSFASNVFVKDSIPQPLVAVGVLPPKALEVSRDTVDPYCILSNIPTIFKRGAPVGISTADVNETIERKLAIRDRLDTLPGEENPSGSSAVEKEQLRLELQVIENQISKIGRDAEEECLSKELEQVTWSIRQLEC